MFYRAKARERMVNQMVKIGHASIDERGKGRGGTAGDQTGREVYIRQWYDKNWNLVLRPKKATVAEKSAKACEKGCANSHIGYDMDQRNTAHTQAKLVKYDLSKIKIKCETDCSAFMTLCALAAGVKSLEYTGNAPTTSTMRKAFSASGEYEVLEDKKYLTSDAYLKRGDILVSEGHHTAMCLENGSKVKAAKTTSNTSAGTKTSHYEKCAASLIGLVFALSSIGVDSSYEHRAKIAKANGITNYKGTAEQNTKLLNLLKQGKLIRA